MVAATTDHRLCLTYLIDILAEAVAGHPRHSGHEIQSFVEVADFEEKLLGTGR
jgi:hypothetical protein